MADNLKFYYTDDGTTLPTETNNGNIYFVLDDKKDEENNNIASLFLDIEDKRYLVKPFLKDATIEKSGLLSNEDKKKLIGLTITPTSLEGNIQNPAKVNIGVNSSKSNKTINFSDYIYIKNDQVLTANSIQKVDIEPIIIENEGDEVPEASASVIPIKGEDGKFYLKLTLPIPRGKQGKQGEQGIPGKPALIGKVKAKIDSSTIIETDNLNNDVIPIEVKTEYTKDENKTDFTFNMPLIQGRTGNTGPQGNIGPRGPQGHAADVEFNFLSTQGDPYGEVKKISENGRIENEDGSVDNIVKYKYNIYIPRGERGESGRPFRIDHLFEHYSDIVDELNKTDSAIKYGDFILLKNSDQTDNDVGKLYYYSYSKNGGNIEDKKNGLVYLTDMSPVQPTFSAGNVETLQSTQAPYVNVRTINNDVSKPILDFGIPRGETGKSLLAGTANVTVDKNIGTPQGSMTLNTTSNSNDPDEKYLNLDLNLENLGTDIEATATVDNKTGTPSVKIEKQTINRDANGPIQKFNFKFSGLKGEEGTAANTFSNDLISAHHYTDSQKNYGLPYAEVEAFNENNKLGLSFNFYNLKGNDGNLGSINVEGNGNAITNIVNNGSNGISVEKGKTFATVSDIANFDRSDTIRPVKTGGTGNSFLQSNAVLLGNQTDSVKQVASKSGAFYSDSTGGEPVFGTLPVRQGGTGQRGFKAKSLLISGNPDVVGQNTSTTITTLSNTQLGVLINDIGGSLGFVNSLPVEYGGTGIAEFVPYTVPTIDGNASIAFQSSLGVSYGGTGRNGFTQNATLIGGTVNNGSQIIDEIPSSAGAFFSTGDNERPGFDILPIEYGGTGATNFQDALTELGALYGSLEETYDVDDYCLKLEGVFT